MISITLSNNSKYLKWKRWYAWKPVQIIGSDRKVWFKLIWRRAQLTEVSVQQPTGTLPFIRPWFTDFKPIKTYQYTDNVLDILKAKND